MAKKQLNCLILNIDLISDFSNESWMFTIPTFEYISPVFVYLIQYM